MAMSVNEIMQEYSKGTIGLADANRMLKEASKFGLQIDPYKNVLTASEAAEIVVSNDPTKCSGYGFMNHGIGTPEKMHLKNGKFDYDTGFDESTRAVFYIGGKMFRVMHDHIEVIKG